MQNLNENEKKAQPEMLMIPKNKPLATVASRRINCYGFFAGVYIKDDFAALNAFLTQIRDKIMQIVDPDGADAIKPRKLPHFIKNKDFHASMYGSSPFMKQEDYAAFFKAENEGLANGAYLQIIQDHLTVYLNEKEPHLEPIQFEFKRDGTVFARFRVSTKDNDSRPLASLKQKLDGNQLTKAKVWDPDPIRDTTVTVVLCATYLKHEPTKVLAIRRILQEANQTLVAFGSLAIKNITILESYDKRTLSQKHTKVFGVASKEEKSLENQISMNI